MSDKENKAVPITREQLLEAIKQVIKQQDLERQGLKEDREKKKSGGSIGSMMDVPLYYDQKPTVISLINKFRNNLGYADGGKVSDKDIGQVKYLISILEQANWLTHSEQKALDELREDLKKMTGVRAND